MKELDQKILQNHLNSIYKDKNFKQIDVLCSEIRKIFPNRLKKKIYKDLWNENDCFLITYADSVRTKNKKNFKTLDVFLNKYCKVFNFLHNIYLSYLKTTKYCLLNVLIDLILIISKWFKFQYSKSFERLQRKG